MCLVHSPVDQAAVQASARADAVRACRADTNLVTLIRTWIFSPMAEALTPLFVRASKNAILYTGLSAGLIAWA